MSYNVFDVLKDAITGNLEIVPEDEMKKRLSICKTCIYIKPIPGFSNLIGRCEICGCFMDAKVKYAKSSCPEGKW